MYCSIPLMNVVSMFVCLFLVLSFIHYLIFCNSNVKIINCVSVPTGIVRVHGNLPRLWSRQWKVAKFWCQLSESSEEWGEEYEKGFKSTLFCACSSPCYPKLVRRVGMVKVILGTSVSTSGKIVSLVRLSFFQFLDVIIFPYGW